MNISFLNDCHLGYISYLHVEKLRGTLKHEMNRNQNDMETRNVEQEKK